MQTKASKFVRTLIILINIVWGFVLLGCIALFLNICINLIFPGIDIPISYPSNLPMPQEVHFQIDDTCFLQTGDGETNEVTIRMPRGQLIIHGKIPRKMGLLFRADRLFRHLLVFIIVTLLRSILYSLKSNSPFITNNVIRIRWIGFLVIIYDIYRNLNLINNHYFWMKFSSESIKVIKIYEFLKFEFLALGLLVICLAEVFRIGIKMREDQELTI